MATIKFNMADAATKAEVAGWTPDTEYVVMTGADPTNGVVETVEPEEEEVPEEEAAASAAAPGPAAVAKAMGG